MVIKSQTLEAADLSAIQRHEGTADVKALTLLTDGSNRNRQEQAVHFSEIAASNRDMIPLF